MSDPARELIREPGSDDPRHYAARVRRLAALYVCLFVLSVAGIALLIWQAQLFVTLTQRSNVETLTLAFLFVFFAYLVVLSAPGTWGVIKILRHSVGGTWQDQQQRKMRALGQPTGASTVADLNVIVEREDRPRQAFELSVADRVGRMGRLRIDGARLSYMAEHRDGSNDILAFVERQIGQVLKQRGDAIDIEIVTWKKVEDEAAERYHGMVEFARNLAGQMGKGDLWPTIRLTTTDCEAVERRLAEICPALRNEGFLPQWDFAAEHKVPIIPEPLGLVTLSRTEQRVDPVSSMGCAVLVVIFAVVALALFTIVPPWVPGT
jgi:hypothetical protein